MYHLKRIYCGKGHHCMTDREKKALSIGDEEKARFEKEYTAGMQSKDITLSFPGEPMGYSRPRYRSVKGRFGFFYNPKSKIEHQYRIQVEKDMKDAAWLSALVHNPDANYYVVMEGNFYMPIPKGDSLKEIYLKENRIELPSSKRKKDIDNLIKPWLDIFNTVMYDDDKRVMILNAHKYFSVDPRAEWKLHYVMYPIPKTDKKPL